MFGQEAVRVPEASPRIILHADMNNYFASVEEKFSPRLKHVPFAVCGDPEMRHSIVMARNSLAKKYGITAGISFKQARLLCPNLVYIKADYEKYLRETKEARKIYKKYTDTVIPYGLDEAWLDLTETGVNMAEARQIADLIRIEIMYSRGLSASVGVSDNLIFSKLGSDYKKPNATTLITRENYREIVWPLPSSDLLFVGEKRRKLLSAFGINTIGDIASADPRQLSKLLGKVGYDLWNFSRGIDSTFHPENDSIKSIGNTITPPEDLKDSDEVKAVLYLLACSVAARLKKHGLMLLTLGINVRDGSFCNINRRRSLGEPIYKEDEIYFEALKIFESIRGGTFPVRSLGVRAENLIPAGLLQQSLFTKEPVHADIDDKLIKLKERFGELSVEQSSFSQESHFISQ